MFSAVRGLGAGRVDDLGGGFDEAVRILRANLSVGLADLVQPSVVVTSATADEGKTTVCCHLALAFAAAGQRVIVIDLDLRHPDAHRLLGAHNKYGATDVLLGRRSLQESLQYVETSVPDEPVPTGLYFLAAGEPVPNPADLLAGGRTARLLESLGGQADIVLLDSPAVLPVADTLVIGRIASGAVLVTETGRTAIDAVEKAKDLLVRNHTRLLGVAVNKFSGRGDQGPPAGGYDHGSAAPLHSRGAPAGNGLTRGATVRTGR